MPYHVGMTSNPTKILPCGQRFSLADKEMNDTDLASILAALAEMADERDVQVIVTHKGHQVAVNALGAESVIGPSSAAGHIF